MQTEPKQTNKKLLTREWGYIIVIITIVQGWIWYTAFVNAHNASALNYISFAGTLISIILAVLAIGYTYGESVKQKNSSDTVVNQISKLNDVIATIEMEASALQKISDIARDLQHFKENISNINTTVAHTHESLNEFIAFEKNLKTPLPLATNINKNDLAKLFASVKTGFIQNPLLVYLTITEDEQIIENPVIHGVTKYRNYIRELEDNSIEENEENKRISQSELNWDIGSVALMGSILQNFGLIYFDKKAKKMTISEELKRNVKEITIVSEVNMARFYQKLREKLIENISF